jgi:hypothetical protein
MELTPEQVKSLEEALKAYIARQTAAGQPELKDASQYLIDFNHLKAFTAPLDDEIKIKMAYILGSFASGDQARAYVDWIKESTTLRGQPLATLFNGEKGATTFEFLNAISKEAYDAYARANPLSYVDVRASLKERGLDTSFAPPQQDIDAALSRMDPRRYDVHDLKHAKDPALLLRIGTEILDENRGTISAERIGSILLREHFDKFTALPGGQAIINRAIKASAGIDMEGGPAVPPGTLKIDKIEVAFLSRKLAGKVDIDGALLRNLQRDPLAALTYAAENYPKDSKAMTAYLAALPRAQELLDTPEHTTTFVRMLNALEPSQYAGEPHRLIPEKDVFKLLEKTRPEQLYDIITRSITNNTYEYTHGTYNAVLDDMFRKMKAEGKSLSDVAGSSPERQERLRSFLEAAAVYNRMPDTIKGTSPAEHESIARLLLQKQEDRNLDLATNAEFIKALPKGSQVLPFIESSLIVRAHEGSEYDKADVGMMAYWYANNSGHTPSADNKGFFDKVSRDESFQVKPLDRIAAGTLLDAGKRNFQLHVFFNDKDGIDTFKSFSASMRADGWTTKKQDDFLILSKEKDGRRIEMLVSPPDSGKDSIKHIQDYVAEKGGKISVLIGRGHAHHMGEAVELITKDTKLVTLGGCWGHNYVTSVIDRSPEAHILSTSGVGRMAINNATTRWLNDQILSGRDLDWKQLQKFWDTLAKDKTLAKDAALYVAPDKNIMLNFERRRAELYEQIERGDAQPGPQSQFRSSFMQSVRGPEAEGEPAPQPKAREISRAPLQQTAEYIA